LWSTWSLLVNSTLAKLSAAGVSVVAAAGTGTTVEVVLDIAVGAGAMVGVGALLQEARRLAAVKNSNKFLGIRILFI
jgi:hypothetical protein